MKSAELVVPMPLSEAVEKAADVAVEKEPLLPVGTLVRLKPGAFPVPHFDHYMTPSAESLARGNIFLITNGSDGLRQASALWIGLDNGMPVPRLSVGVTTIFRAEDVHAVDGVVGPEEAAQQLNIPHERLRAGILWLLHPIQRADLCDPDSENA